MNTGTVNQINFSVMVLDSIDYDNLKKDLSQLINKEIELAQEVQKITDDIEKFLKEKGIKVLSTNWETCTNEGDWEELLTIKIEDISEEKANDIKAMERKLNLETGYIINVDFNIE